MTDTADQDAVTPDPFFALPEDSRWNACIGVQGSEENYVDGFMQAATELAELIIEKRMIGRRDTLVLPILYNARHGLELALKYAIDRLHRFGLLPDPAVQDHDIAAAYERLQTIELGDAVLRGLVDELGPYVSSLSAVDGDGQELRYAETTEGRKSLVSLALANLDVIRTSLRTLSRVLERLKYRLHELEEERATGTFTSKCSRRDLYRIAERLPPRDAWREEAFDAVRLGIRRDFGLSSKQLSDALNVIQAQRELRQGIGMPNTLAHLSDDHIRLAVAQWSPIHPPRTRADGLDLGLGLQAFDAEAFRRKGELYRDAVDAVVSALSANEVTDLEAIYEIGRSGHMCEAYEQLVAFTLEVHSRQPDRRGPVDRLMHKTNFLTATAAGLKRLGRSDLADEIMSLRPDLQ